MTQLRENFPLKYLHTFGTEAYSRYFLEFTNPLELVNYLDESPFHSDDEWLILGGGSNMLFVGDYPGLIVAPRVGGIDLVDEDSQHVWVKAGAGITWDDFVQFAVSKGWGGIENLSLIPGRVGASPVQNIGAYGQEAGRVIDSVSGVDLLTGKMREINMEDCCFGYRNSVFKEEMKGSYVITSVVYKLNKNPKVDLSYKGVAEKLHNLREPGIADVREAIISIRQSKLPDPAVLGNAGSFFKNPVVSQDNAETLLLKYPGIPVYPMDNEHSKLSAGWLIDRCGWKGVRRGDAGVHTDHALVLVNYGKATGQEIFKLSEDISRSIFETFGVTLDREVIAVGALPLRQGKRQPSGFQPSGRRKCKGERQK